MLRPKIDPPPPPSPEDSPPFRRRGGGQRPPRVLAIRKTNFNKIPKVQHWENRLGTPFSYQGPKTKETFQKGSLPDRTPWVKKLNLDTGRKLSLTLGRGSL